MKKLILSITAMFTLATSAFAQIGSLSSDLVYTPLTPCRIVDTRVAGGTIPALATRGFKAWGASFAAQGGSATPCGIPQNTNVAALDLNVVVVGTGADGYITLFPFGVAQPTASTLNYLAGAVLANGAAVKVSQASLANDWNVYTSAATHFVADVTGYYSKPVATALDCVLSAQETFAVPANFSGFHFTASVCPASYTPVSSYCFNNNDANLYLNGSGTRNAPWCGWKNNAATATTAQQAIECCRIPGR